MSENEHKIENYNFEDLHSYKEAKREAETVEYIRANTDLNDINKTLKLYHRLVERGTLKTVVGYDFLRELREQIIRGGIVTENNLPPIRIEKEKSLRAYKSEIDHETEHKHLEMIEDYKIKLRNSRIISIFLLAIIIAMILISVFSDRSIFTNYENKVIDKYSSWEEDLNARQKDLDEREAALEEKEAIDSVR